MSEIERVKEIDTQIAKLQKEREELYAILRMEQITESMPTSERFRLWLELEGPSEDYPFIEQIISSSGKELFDWDTWPMYPERRETFWIADIASRLFELSDDDLKRYNVSEQDIYDWMEALMRLKVRSICYDW